MPTQNEIALHLDLSVRSVRNLQSEGVLSKDNTLDEARVAYIRRLREQAAARLSKDGGADLVAERARLSRLQADKVEIEIAVKRGELVSLVDAERAWSALVGAFRSKMLTLASRAAAATLGKSEAETMRILDDIVREALQELSHWEVGGDIESIPRSVQSSGDCGTPAQDTDQSMG